MPCEESMASHGRPRVGSRHRDQKASGRDEAVRVEDVVNAEASVDAVDEEDGIGGRRADEEDAASEEAEESCGVRIWVSDAPIEANCHRCLRHYRRYHRFLRCLLGWVA